MPTDSVFGTTCKSVLLCLIAVIWVLTTPLAQATKWTIHVTITGPEQLSYTVDPPNALDCDGSKPVANQLCIKAGDEVNWDVHTSGGKGWLTVYHKDAFLFKSGVSARYFHAQESQSDGGASDPKPPFFRKSHEYVVAVFDDEGSNSHLYIDDPKIIVGGSVMAASCQDLVANYVNDDKTEAQKNLIDKAIAACSTLREDLQKLSNHK